MHLKIEWIRFMINFICIIAHKDLTDLFMNNKRYKIVKIHSVLKDLSPTIRYGSRLMSNK